MSSLLATNIKGQSIQKETATPTTVIDSGKNAKLADTTKKVRSNASKAALRSAILPGLGQVYNKKYWKVPIVYGLLAIPVSTYSYNSTWYNKTRFAYTTRMTKDSANFPNIAPELQPLSSSSLRLYRNEFRKGMDFSILGFLLLWGVNIIDAAVDGHLKGFDISDELSLKIAPKFSPGPGQMGITATLHFKGQKAVK
ncbi:MAG: DUF5683 domain-containing protein [bacterium]